MLQFPYSMGCGDLKVLPTSWKIYYPLHFGRPGLSVDWLAFALRIPRCPGMQGRLNPCYQIARATEIPRLVYQQPTTIPPFFRTSRLPILSGAASAPMGALQAIRFAIANCGCLHDCNLLDSRRIAGIYQSRAIARPPKKQADSLTLNATRILERATCQAAHVYDRLCFGTFLIALYSRARWNDLQHASSIEVDSPTPECRYDGSSFISTPTWHFKTSSSSRRNSFSTHHTRDQSLVDAQNSDAIRVEEMFTYAPPLSDGDRSTALQFPPVFYGDNRMIFRSRLLSGLGQFRVPLAAVDILVNDRDTKLSV